MTEEAKRVLTCGHCGTDIDVTYEEFSELEVIECPMCGTDCYTETAELKNEDPDIDPDGYDVDEELDFN